MKVNVLLAPAASSWHFWRITNTQRLLGFWCFARRRSMRSSFLFFGRIWPFTYAPSMWTSPSSLSSSRCSISDSRILCASTKAVLYWTPRSRLNCKDEMPFTALVKMAMAARYTFSGSLWKAKIVPLVTENVCLQSLHCHCFRVALK